MKLSTETALSWHLVKVEPYSLLRILQLGLQGLLELQINLEESPTETVLS